MTVSQRYECSVCYATLPRPMRFCPHCGSPQTPSAVQEAVRPPTQPPPSFSASERSRLERAFRAQFEKRGLAVEQEQLEQARSVLLSTEKQVRRASMLFLDLCKFTQISHQLGPDKTRDLLQEHDTICAKVVYRHHGFIVKFVGDGIVAVFGAPLAYDRDAESCLRAALEMRELIAGLEPGLGFTLHTHAGIATGEVFSGVTESAGAPEYDVTGDAVNLAARLKSRARADEILVCQATAVAIQDVFEIEPMPPMRLKNIGGLYTAHRVVGEKQTGILRRPIRTEFVGRTAEIRKIHETLERAQAGHLEILEIVGEPGVGKSRLFAEAIRSFGGKATLLACECAPHGAESLLFPLIELIRKICDIGPGDSLPRTREKIEQFCRDNKIAPDDAAAIGYLLGLPDAIESMAALPFPTIQQRVFDALTKIAVPQRQDELKVLCLDDIQWMDPLTGQWLEHLLERAAATNLALVLIYRTRDKPEPKFVCPAVRIRLGPLSQRHRTEVVRQIIGHDYGKQAVHEAILDRAGGNPLFLEEIARLADQMERSKGLELSEQLEKPLADIVPESLHSIIQYRIDRLERRTRAVLECAAVLGRRFSFGVIQLFDSIRRNLVEQLSVLRGLRFLDEYPPPPDVEYAFLHPLAREVAYQNLPAAQRRTLHGEIAKQMEQYLGQRVSEYYSTLAYHFEKAEDAPKALYYTVKSAERAVALFANREALKHYEKALRWLQTAEDGEHALVRQSFVLIAIGRLRRILGDVNAGLEALEQSLQLIGKVGNAHLQAHCAYEMSALHQAKGDYLCATQHATDALELARRQERRPLEAQCHNMLGMIAWGQSQYDEALKHYRNVFDLGVDEAAPGVVADAHNNAGLIHWQRGRYEMALTHMHECLRLGRTMGDRYRIAATVMNIGILQERLGRLGAARRSYANALTLSREIGFRQAACACHANLSNLDLIEKKPADALDQAARSNELARAIRDRRSEAIAEENLALACLLAKDFGRAREHFDRAMRLARNLGDVERQVSVGLGMVELELATQEKDVTTRKVQSLLKTIEIGGFDDHRPRALRNLGRILALRSESRREAETMLHKALEEAKRLSNIPERDACRREIANLT
jgi:class 3 adenylate cyclase/tetratricopeptide (TPR) repeat protein